MRYLRNLRFEYAVSLGCIAMLGYFAWHALEGPRGYSYRDGLEIQLAKLNAEQEELRQARLGLEAKVALMRPESVDPDMLDELARSQLQLTGPNELIVKYDN